MMLSSSCAASPEGESSSPSSALIAASASWPAERWSSSSCCGPPLSASRSIRRMKFGRPARSRSSRRRHPQEWPRRSGRWPGPAPVRPGRPPGPRRNTSRGPLGTARPWSRRNIPESHGKRRRRPRPRSGWWRRSPSEQTTSLLRPGWRRGFGPGFFRDRWRWAGCLQVACLLFSKLWTGMQLSKGIATLNGVKGAISSTVPFAALRVTTGAEPPLRTPASQHRLCFHPFGN